MCHNFMICSSECQYESYDKTVHVQEIMRWNDDGIVCQFSILKGQGRCGAARPITTESAPPQHPARTK